MSRIGVARVEKRQELDVWRVHDFYALTGLDKARNEISQVSKKERNLFSCSHLLLSRER